jgi:hypothetical protein
MTQQAQDESTKVLHQGALEQTSVPAAKRAYHKPELTLFGSVEEFTRGSGYGTLDANGKNRRAG